MFWFSNIGQNSGTKCGLKRIYSCKLTGSTFSWKDVRRILFWKCRRNVLMRPMSKPSNRSKCWDRSSQISSTPQYSLLGGSTRANPRKCKTLQSQRSNRRTQMLEMAMRATTIRIKIILRAWRAITWKRWKPKSRRAICQRKMMKSKVKEPWAILSRSKTQIQAPRCWALSKTVINLTCIQFKKQWRKQRPPSLKLRSMPGSRRHRIQEKRREKGATCLQPSAQ